MRARIGAVLFLGFALCAPLVPSFASGPTVDPARPVAQSVTGRAQVRDASLDVTVYSQPPNPAGGFFQTSQAIPDGSDSDRIVWDAFVLPRAAVITEIRWRGAYDPALAGSGGPVSDFSVAICASIIGGGQPDVVATPLVELSTGDNAGETSAGTAGGAAMFDYHVVLPMPFVAAARTRYWLRIVASQTGTPNWGIAAGTGGDGTHFLRLHYFGGQQYRNSSGDTSFTLLAAPTPTANRYYLPAVLR
jgi:hypothetical protein